MTGHLYLNETKEKIKYLNEGSYKVYKVIFMNVTGWHIYTYSKSTVKTQDQGPLILFQCFDNVLTNVTMFSWSCWNYVPRKVSINIPLLSWTLSHRSAETGFSETAETILSLNQVRFHFSLQSLPEYNKNILIMIFCLNLDSNI